MGRLILASVGLSRRPRWGGPIPVLLSPHSAPRLASAMVPALAGGTAADSAMGAVPSPAPGPITGGDKQLTSPSVMVELASPLTFG